MSDDVRMTRQRIGEAIQADRPDLDMRGEGVTATITGWAVVAEWMDSDGRRWLSKNCGDAAGEALTNWQMAGMLHEALYGEWPEAEEDA